MELIDPALLENIRRDGVLLRSSDKQERFCFIHGRWRFFYSLHGAHAPEKCTDENNDHLPDYVERILCKLERGYTLLRDLFGLIEPLDDELRYIDVTLDDIPTLHGVASGRPKNIDHAILVGTPYGGPALGVRLHRGLIDQTATPQHELFHLYQYGYVPFINSWFMEGLATWYHRLFKNYAAREENLPASASELASLVQRKHDAEAFWGRLFRLCDYRQSEVPAPYCDYFEVKQTQFPGRVFLKQLLDTLAHEYAAPLETLPNTEKIDHRGLLNNNILIFRAMLRAIEALAPERNEELDKFVALLSHYADPLFASYSPPPIQRLLEDLREAGDICPVYKHHNILHSPYFDPLTGTLTVEALRLRRVPTSFESIRRISGNLYLEITETAEFQGLNALETVTGTLVVANNPSLVTLNGFAALREIGGALHVEHHPLLESLNAFPVLRTIRKDLRLSNCPRLTAINGISQLRTVGGSLEISDLLALREIRFLHCLEAVNDLTIRKCPIEDGEPLRLLFTRNPEFKGGIRITETQLHDVHFLSALRRVGSSLYLSQNRIARLDGLEQLEAVGASFALAFNGLSDLTPLHKLHRVDGILSLTNNALTSLAGLESLTSLYTKKWGDTPSTLRIYGNPDLHDISALANIEASDHYLILHLDQGQTFTRKPPADAPFHRNILQLQDFRSGTTIPSYRFVTKATHDYRRFRHAIHNKWLECLIDLETDADTLVIAFTGTTNSHCPRVIDALKAHRILVADHQGMWYQGGISGLSKNIDGTLALIAALAQARPYRRIVCFGTAMGGYMAILAGWLLKADQVIAFSPHTCLAPDILHSWNDRRFDREVNKLPKTIDPAYLDLEKCFAAHPNHHTEVRLFFSDTSPVDKSHAAHLAERPNIHRIPYEIRDRLIKQGQSEADADDAEAYLAIEPLLNQSYEFVDHAVSALPTATTRQMAISLNLAGWLFNHFRNKRFRVHAAHMKLYVAAANAFFYPDLFVTRAESSPAAQTCLDDAVLVVEVLDGSAQAFDKGSKSWAYRKIPSLREYVVIDAQTRHVMIWRRETGKWISQENTMPENLTLESLDVAVPASVLFDNLC